MERDGTGWNAYPITGWPRWTATQNGGSVKKQLVRLVVMLATSVGLVALVADAAYARITLNHSEPTR